MSLRLRWLQIRHVPPFPSLLDGVSGEAISLQTAVTTDGEATAKWTAEEGCPFSSRTGQWNGIPPGSLCRRVRGRWKLPPAGAALSEGRRSDSGGRAKLAADEPADERCSQAVLDSTTDVGGGGCGSSPHPQRKRIKKVVSFILSSIDSLVHSAALLGQPQRAVRTVDRNRKVYVCGYIRIVTYIYILP